jgi:hypothetical protein
MSTALQPVGPVVLVDDPELCIDVESPVVSNVVAGSAVVEVSGFTVVTGSVGLLVGKVDTVADPSTHRPE